MAKKMTCDICGEERFIEHKLKDGTNMCGHCEKKISDGFIVEWKKITVDDFHYFNEIPMADDSFNPDFEFEGFKADTKAGVFSLNLHKQLFEFKKIKKYYIKYIYKDISSTSSNSAKEVKGARLVIELDHPVITGIQQKIPRDKESLFEMLDVLDIVAKKSYEKHNEKILQLLKEQTGKNISLPKRENQ